MGAHGRTAGVSGGSSLLGQEQVSDEDIGTPELEQLGLLEVDMDWMEAAKYKKRWLELEESWLEWIKRTRF